MYKYLIAIALFVLCCSVIKTQAQQADAYPNEIKFYRLQRQYDIAKWYFYCQFADDEVKFAHEFRHVKSMFYCRNIFQLPVLTYGELPLVFDTLLMKGDSAEIVFTFYFEDIPCDGWHVYNGGTWGVVFVNSVYPAFMHTEQYDAHMFFLQDKKHRELLWTEKHRSVHNYIIRNQAIIDPWLRKEAKERGVL